ncbi:MAG: sarcosine oxidase subunit delta [Pseudomonadota bacterium]
MLRLFCPYCRIYVDETELVPGGEAHLRRAGPGASDAEFEAYLFHRANPKGVHIERWRHIYGCGKWFHVARCTMTNEVFGSYTAQVIEPPADIIAAIQAKRPGWAWEAAS